jgi:hypothetical protein
MIEDMCRLFEERFPHISRVHNHDHDHDHEQEVSAQQQEEEEESSYGPPGLTME